MRLNLGRLIQRGLGFYQQGGPYGLGRKLDRRGTPLNWLEHQAKKVGRGKNWHLPSGPSWPHTKRLVRQGSQRAISRRQVSLASSSGAGRQQQGGGGKVRLFGNLKLPSLGQIGKYALAGGAGAIGGFAAGRLTARRGVSHRGAKRKGYRHSKKHHMKKAMQRGISARDEAITLATLRKVQRIQQAFKKGTSRRKSAGTRTVRVQEQIVPMPMMGYR